MARSMKNNYLKESKKSKQEESSNSTRIKENLPSTIKTIFDGKLKEYFIDSE